MAVKNGNKAVTGRDQAAEGFQQTRDRYRGVGEISRKRQKDGRGVTRG